MVLQEKGIIAHTGNFVRLREFAEGDEIELTDYPNVVAWIEKIEARESFRATG